MLSTRAKRFVVALLAATAALLVLWFKYKIFAALLLAAILVIATIGILSKRLANLAMMFCAFLLPFLALEAALLLFADSRPKLHIVVEPDFYPPHPQLGYLPTPGTYKVSQSINPEEPFPTVTYTIGEDGFRTTPGNPPGTPTVYFLGCSFTFGYGLGDDQTLPFYFSKLNPELAVKNYGMTAYGLAHSYLILNERINQQGALVVVQTAPWQATRSACIDEWLSGHPKFIVDADDKLQNAGSCYGFIEKASHVRLLKHSLLYGRFLLLLKALWTSQKEVPELYLALIREMKRETDARSERLVVAYIRGGDAFTGQWGRSDDDIMEEIRSMGAEVVDVTLAPKGDAIPKEFLLHESDTHPSALANERRAALLSDYLRTSRHVANETPKL